MESESPNYVLEFMEKMKKSLTSTSIPNPESPSESKKQNFPSLRNGFSTSLGLSLNPPALKQEPEDLIKKDLLREIKKESSLNGFGENLSKMESPKKEYTDFIKNNLELKELTTLTYSKKTNNKR